MSRNHCITASHLTLALPGISLLKAHFLYYHSYTAAGNKTPLTASYWFLCGCCWCVVHTAIMMSQTSISTKNFTTLLWAWLGNGSALYCKLLCWLGESAMGARLLVGWKWEFPPELPAPGFRMPSSKDWVGTKWEGGQRSWSNRKLIKASTKHSLEQQRIKPSSVRPGSVLISWLYYKSPYLKFIYLIQHTFYDN